MDGSLHSGIFRSNWRECQYLVNRHEATKLRNSINALQLILLYINQTQYNRHYACPIAISYLFSQETESLEVTRGELYNRQLVPTKFRVNNIHSSHLIWTTRRLPHSFISHKHYLKRWRKLNEHNGLLFLVDMTLRTFFYDCALVKSENELCPHASVMTKQWLDPRQEQRNEIMVFSSS